MEAEFLDALCTHVIRKDYDNDEDEFPYDPAAPEDLEAYYDNIIGFLEEEDWDYIIGKIEEWNEGNESAQDPKNDSAYGEFEAAVRAFDELIDRCCTLPTCDIVRRRVGIPEAEHYRQCLESVEDREDVDLNIDAKESAKIRWRKSKVEELVQLVSLIAANETPYEAGLAYMEQQEREREEKRKRRRERRRLNEPVRQRAKALGLWLPRAKDWAEWEKFPALKDRFQYFRVLVDQVEAKLRKEKCILQYVPRRKLTKEALRHFDSNLQAMSAYLTRDD